MCLTYPHIGNVGANLDDEEATRQYIESLVVREFSQISSNWRSAETAELYLNRHKIPVLWDIDTRALVRHIRKVGALRGIVVTDGTPAEQSVFEAKQLPTMAGQELAGRVTCGKAYDWQKGSIDLATSPWAEQMGEAGASASPDTRKFKVVAYDYGIKQNILRKLRGEGCKVTVVPAQTPAEDVLALKPNGVFLSNGPGDPEPCSYAVDNIRRLMGRQPIFGICLGHQLTGIALGGKTYKLKFGHHGGNHPVKQMNSCKIEITAHNHNFAVDPDSLPQSEVELTHIDLNDNTLEGMRHRNLPLFTVQYHPEAAPGPHDSHYLFKDFVKMMEEWKG